MLMYLNYDDVYYILIDTVIYKLEQTH